MSRCLGSLIVLLLYFINVQRSSRAGALTFDNRLAILADDCYTRISIGAKLPDAIVSSRVDVSGLSECESECSKKKKSCNAFSFGVGVKGNGSCAISVTIPSLHELEAHPDYDVYLKRQDGSPWCMSILYENFKPASPQKFEGQSRSKAGAFGNGFPTIVPRGKDSATRDGSIDQGRFEKYVRTVDDEHRVSDIVRNKNQGTVGRSPFERLRHFTYFDEYGAKAPTFPPREGLRRKPEFGERNEFFKTVEPVQPFNYFPSLHFPTLPVTRKPGFSTVYRLSSSVLDNRLPGNAGQTVTPWTSLKFGVASVQNSSVGLHQFKAGNDQQKRKPAACYRKRQPGKKTTEVHVGRVFDCENVQDCRRACDYEKGFPCEGFNYRRGGDYSSPRGIGTCELTSTPYPSMDLYRDFVFDSRCDYYDRNRDCSSERSRDPWWNREYWADVRPRVYGPEKRPPETIPRHVFEGKQIFYPGSYPFDRESVGPYKSSGRYGPFNFPGRREDYDYYRDTDRPKIPNDLPYPAHRTNYDERPPPPSPPRNGDQNFYGDYYHYGNGFGYDNHIPASSKNDLFGENESKCSIRAAPGSKLHRGLIRKTYLTTNLDQCDELCINEQTFHCATFSYRYNVVATDPTNNCLLSDVPYQQLHFYTDLEPDRNYDVYAILENSKACNMKKAANRNPSDECFSRVRSGFSMPTDITKKSVLVDHLGECQVACTMSQEFLCRSFAFRYAMNPHQQVSDRASPNCFLSDWPSREINPANMPDMDGTELYERGSFDRGCEPYPFPFVDPATQNGPRNPIGPDEACYSGYHRPCKLTPRIVISSMRVDSEPDCRRKCSTMRKLDFVPCMSFSYKIGGGETEDNCLLSDVPLRDLRPNVDYIYDDGHVLYAWKDIDPHCGSLLTPSNSLPTDPVGGPPGEDIGEPPFLASQFGIGPPNFPFREGNEPRPDGQHDIGHDSIHVSGGFDRGFGIFYPSQFSTFRRYTVNGHRCKNGTQCEQNKVAGFWSCEIEDSEYGSWDYCCEPKHRCGFSEGYSYPWCYVGSNEDQWRPCSETYYPYYLPADHSEKRHLMQQSKRHWPIIYLHQDAPPNCTNTEGDGGNRNRRSKRHLSFKEPDKQRRTNASE